MSDRVRLELDGPIAIVTNDNPEKHNAFDDEMDERLFAIFAPRAHAPGASGHPAAVGP
jgi:enoyl-CoA hydratase/carnithine racemase